MSNVRVLANVRKDFSGSPYCIKYIICVKGFSNKYAVLISKSVNVNFTDMVVETIQTSRAPSIHYINNMIQEGTLKTISYYIPQSTGRVHSDIYAIELKDDLALMEFLISCGVSY